MSMRSSSWVAYRCEAWRKKPLSLYGRGAWGEGKNMKITKIDLPSSRSRAAVIWRRLTASRPAPTPWWSKCIPTKASPASTTVGPAPWGGDPVEVIKLQIERYLQPALLGQDPFNIERLHLRMGQALRNAVNAYTAIDFALWDIKGKALGVPVYQLLGGSCMPGALCHGFVEREEPERWRRASRNLPRMVGPGSKPRSASA